MFNVLHRTNDAKKTTFIFKIAHVIEVYFYMNKLYIYIWENKYKINA